MFMELDTTVIHIIFDWAFILITVPKMNGNNNSFGH